MGPTVSLLPPSPTPVPFNALVDALGGVALAAVAGATGGELDVALAFVLKGVGAACAFDGKVGLEFV